MNASDSQDRPSPLSVGTALADRYRILGILGMGSLSVVYQARDLHYPNVHKLVAVKESINLAQDQQLRETTMRNFEREAEILVVFSHPAISYTCDFFTIGDRAYLVMEFIFGKDLEAILNNTQDFLPVEAIRQWGMRYATC
jgi:serine/threonine protein kinase